jgi:membrane protein
LATVLWLLATAVVGIYVTFSNPGSAYGVVGSVLVLLFFLYITGIVFILGAELNAVLVRRYELTTAEDLATKPEAKGITRKIVRERAHQP